MGGGREDLEGIGESVTRIYCMKNYLTVFFQLKKIKIEKDKEELRNCLRLEENKDNQRMSLRTRTFFSVKVIIELIEK